MLKKPDSIRWDELYAVTKEIIMKGQVFRQTVDRLSVSEEEMTSGEGYRLLWYDSSKKVKCDSQRRARQLQRATQEWMELRDRLQGPKTRFRERSKVDAAVQEILEKYDSVTRIQAFLAVYFFVLIVRTLLELV